MLHHKTLCRYSRAKQSWSTALPQVPYYQANKIDDKSQPIPDHFLCMLPPPEMRSRQSLNAIHCTRNRKTEQRKIKPPNYRFWWPTEKIWAAHMWFFLTIQMEWRSQGSLTQKKNRYVQRNMRTRGGGAVPHNTRPSSLCHPIWRQMRSCRIRWCNAPMTKICKL